MQQQKQIDLFEHVAAAYAQPASGQLDNRELYRMAVGRAGLPSTVLDSQTPVGQLGTKHNLVKRSLRWHQQSLKQLGVIEKVIGKRGVWQLTEYGRGQLGKIRSDIAVVGFSTDLGVALWSNCNRVFDNWDEPIFCAISSPPYPLAQPRAYGNPSNDDYIDFICQCIEPIVRNLVKGGNIVLSLGDVFERRSPAKSTYIEELIIAFRKKFNLSLMNRIVWESNKPPGPIEWASKKRMQLNEGYEYCLWFCNDPVNCIADNRRVLEPHSESHKKLIARGGEKRTSTNGDGAYKIYPGSYSAPTEGKIPRNVFHIANTCASQRQYKQRALELGLVPHGASMPLKLAQKLVKFLTEVGHLVVDPFGGSMTTALACEMEERAWVSTDIVFDYVRGGAERFVEFPGFELGIEV